MTLADQAYSIISQSGSYDEKRLKLEVLFEQARNNGAGEDQLYEIQRYMDSLQMQRSGGLP
jgi:hypothetical protein